MAKTAKSQSKKTTMAKTAKSQAKTAMAKTAKSQTIRSKNIEAFAGALRLRKRKKGPTEIPRMCFKPRKLEAKNRMNQEAREPGIKIHGKYRGQISFS